MFRSLGSKLTALIGVAITVGFVAVVAVFAFVHQRNVLSQNERTVHKITQSVIGGVQAMMLAGHADVAELYAARLKAVADVESFRILRTDGLEAFKDNATIHAVNEIRGDEDFTPRDREEVVRVLAEDDPHLLQVVRNRDKVLYYGARDGTRTLTSLWPILNAEKCHKCHGKARDVRGVLELTTSLAAVDAEVARTWQQAGMIMAALVLGLVSVIAVVLSRSVVAPIEVVSREMRKVSKGDLDREVPVMGRDELARMAVSFNTMIGELRATRSGLRREQDKLQTVLRSSHDGIIVTDDEGRVVLVNPAAERLLDKTAERLVAEGFESMFDDPSKLREMIAGPAGAAHLVIYNQRFLAIVASEIRIDAGRLLGRAALIRDMTDAKRMEQMLHELSNTDGLTGLANRRRLDEALSAEVIRSVEHKRPLSIMMFDVDHFKRFNDEHGHDQGDRVLQAVAHCASDAVRNVDLACRYGGEEFLIILTETAADGAMVMAERLRAAIESLSVDGLKVTVSIGVADLQQLGLSAPDALVAAADAALYAAKRGGRNRVMLAGVGTSAS